MGNKTLIGGVLGVALLLILGSNLLSGGSVLPENSLSQAGVSQHQINSEQKRAPDFTLKTLEGGEITLSSYIGKKPVVLDFFATWCPNCRRDMLKLSKMYDKYSAQVEVIGINLQEKASTVRKFIESRNISFPIVLDPKGAASRIYGIQYTNYHVLINKEGNIVGIVPGDISESDIIKVINS